MYQLEIMTWITHFSSRAYNNLTMRNAVKIQFKARDVLPKEELEKQRKIGNLIKNLYVSQGFLARTQEPQVNGQDASIKGKKLNCDYTHQKINKP